MATVRHPTLGLIRDVEDSAVWIQQGWLPVDDDPAPAHEPVTHVAQPAPSWWQRHKATRTTNP